MKALEEQAYAHEELGFNTTWKIIPVIEDDADDPSRAEEAAHNLVGQGKVAVAITLSSPGAAEAAARVFQQAGVPLVTAVARTPALGAVGDFIFPVWEAYAQLPPDRAASNAMTRVDVAIQRAGDVGRSKLTDPKAIRDELARQPMPPPPQ